VPIVHLHDVQQARIKSIKPHPPSLAQFPRFFDNKAGILRHGNGFIAKTATSLN
jgi:hypothetical protein